MDIKYRDGSTKSLEKIQYQAEHSLVADNSTVLALIQKIKEQEEIIKDLRKEKVDLLKRNKYLNDHKFYPARA